MFGFGKKRKVRRQRAKRLRVESTESTWSVFTRQVGLWPTLVTVVFFVFLILIVSVGERALPYSLNQQIDQPIIARVDFEVPDPKQAAANIKAARAAIPNYYRVNTELVDRVAGELTVMFEAAQAESFEMFEQRAASAAWPADDTVYEYLHAADEARRNGFTQSLERLKANLKREHTVRPTETIERDRDPPSTAGEVIVRYGDSPATSEGNAEGRKPAERRVPIIQLIQIASRDAIDGRALKLSQSFDSRLRPAVHQVLIEILSSEPLLIHDPDRTQAEMAAAQRTAPAGIKRFEKSTPFIQADGTLLTRTHIDLLLAEQSAYLAFLDSSDPDAVKLRSQHRYERLGTGMVLLVLTISLFAYVGLYQPRIFQVQTRSIAFAGLMLLCLVVVRFIDVRFSRMEFVLTPVLLAASILTIAYPRRFAAGVTVIFVVIVALAIRADMGTMIMLFTGGYATAFLLNDIRTRTKIVWAGLVIGVLMFFTTFAFGLIDRQEVSFVFTRAALAAGSAILAALIIQGALPFIEQVFKVATSLTLLEYRDANRPLLHRLAREAPGTYNHSLILGTMSETACEAIGANGRLAHVGALYHDIGKIPKAEYFAENQEASINRHDNLAPTMSLLIILGHVKDGLELAKEYGLPRVLFPFITEHHGTTVVRYFHHVASEKHSHASTGKHDREVAEAEFRYPGPKPASKETAILMLCDGVEGAVRALHEPTAGRIESIVHQVLQARLKDGQFDDCDITLRELHRVEESLVKSLCRFYHGRVAYPKEAKEAKEPSSKPDPGIEESQPQGERKQPV